MKLIVRGGSVVRELVIEETDAGYDVLVGETVYAVRRALTGQTGRSLLIDGHQYEIGVRSLGNGRFAVESEVGTLSLDVIDPLSRLAEETRGGGGSEGPGSVVAYMPGRVAAVLVAEGDRVEAGQGVVVLEAMKMENEIQADREGVVTKIHVEAGQSVDGGDRLFEIT